MVAPPVSLRAATRRGAAHDLFIHRAVERNALTPLDTTAAPSDPGA